MLGKFFQKPTSNDERVPPGQYLTKGMPVLTYGDTPKINLDTWSLRVWGTVDPKSFSWQDILNLPQSDFTKDFHCVTRWSRLDAEWTGIKITDFLSLLTIHPSTTHVMQHCYGDYTTNLTLEEFAREDNFLALKLFGEPLPPDHGGPLRLVVPHLYAWKSGKWLNGLEFLDHQELGFWERNGYHVSGDPWKEERYS